MNPLSLSTDLFSATSSKQSLIGSSFSKPLDSSATAVARL